MLNFLFIKNTALCTLEQNCIPFHLLRTTFVLMLRCNETALTSSLCIRPRIRLPVVQHVLIQLVAFAITCLPQNHLAPC